MIRPVLVIVPSRAAAVELPRRLAATGRAVTGVYAMPLRDLARALAEPALLGRGLAAWDHGHAALLAARLIEETPELALPPGVPTGPVAAALARTLSALRMAGLAEGTLDGLASTAEPDDRARLHGMSVLWRRFLREVEGRHADRACLMREAARRVPEADWLEGAEALVTDELELPPLELELLSALARRIPVRRLRHELPAALHAGSMSAWAVGQGVPEVAWTDTVLGPLAPPPPAGALARLRDRLFAPPAGATDGDPSVELLTAPGEAAEARAIVRRLLKAADEGIPLEEMGIVLPRPDTYAELFTDLLAHAGVPHRLHPSLPLRCGRAARSLLLLFRCRGLERAAVMEFLTFTPAPWTTLLGADAVPRTARWDALSRDAGVVSGLERWRIGLQALSAEERAGARGEKEPERAERRRLRASEAEVLRGLVERLAATLDRLGGDAAWPQWRDTLLDVFAQWVEGHGQRLEHQAVRDVLSDLGGLAALGERARWTQVEAVLEARFDDERLPLEPLATGAVHVGAMDAMAGVPFRWLAIPGLAEGGFPGVLRPDPFLLDAEREALAEPAAAATPPPGRGGQLSLFAAEPAAAQAHPLPTTHDRLRSARRSFHRALRQATGRVVLSYPRADARSGRERLPSLFFVAAATAVHGKPMSAAELAAIVHEDELHALSPADAVDRGERDRLRVRNRAEAAVAAGNVFFRQSRRATRGRWQDRRLGPYDGLVVFEPDDMPGLRDAGIDETAVANVRRRLDPVADGRPISASKLATYARCGFQYLLQHVLRLEPADEPEERKRMDPLERGALFHEVAELFLRERRDAGELPLADTAGNRRRLREIADDRLDAMVARSPPRFALLWVNERERFQQTVLQWFNRELRAAPSSTPAHFEVSFGPARERAEGEPHSEEPVAVDLGDGRMLRVSGKIDRIDRSPDGLVLRDYKTGRLKEQGGVFRGGQQLQIPFYILAARRLWPDQPVVKAFLDYVDGGKVVDFDPAIAEGDDFRAVLRSLLDGIAGGVFVQEPASCNWCDFTQACGPSGLLEARRHHKGRDPRLKQYLRLRDLR